MLPPNIEIDTNISRLPIQEIYEHLITTYWASNRSYDTVEKSIANSINFGMYLDNKLIGFARVVSDKTIFAYLCDVYILPEHQGKGYGKMLMHYVHTFPELSIIRRWFLATKDAHGLYEQVGYTELIEPKRWMEKFRKDL